MMIQSAKARYIFELYFSKTIHDIFLSFHLIYIAAFHSLIFARYKCSPIANAFTYNSRLLGFSPHILCFIISSFNYNNTASTITTLPFSSIRVSTSGLYMFPLAIYTCSPLITPLSLVISSPYFTHTSKADINDMPSFSFSYCLADFHYTWYRHISYIVFVQYAVDTSFLRPPCNFSSIFITLSMPLLHTLYTLIVIEISQYLSFTHSLPKGLYRIYSSYTISLPHHRKVSLHFPRDDIRYFLSKEFAPLSTYSTLQ